MVRVSKVKGNSDKGSMPNSTPEHCSVKESTHNQHRTIYKLHDYSNEPSTGIWYREEIQPISKNKYYVEKIIRHRKSPQGQKKYFVKWQVWPAKFNSWISRRQYLDRKNVSG